MEFRLDQDSLGKVKIPADAYYGAFTGRAINQYHVTGNKAHKNLIDAFVMIKRSAAVANMKTKAIDVKACNAAILKVNQAGSLFDALEFADVANQNNIKLITSHRSGESTDSQISHIGIATKSKMLKVGVVGGERVAKLNELLRLSGHDFICGMAEI